MALVEQLLLGPLVPGGGLGPVLGVAVPAPAPVPAPLPAAAAASSVASVAASASAVASIPRLLLSPVVGGQSAAAVSASISPSSSSCT